MKRKAKQNKSNKEKKLFYIFFSYFIFIFTESKHIKRGLFTVSSDQLEPRKLKVHLFEKWLQLAKSTVRQKFTRTKNRELNKPYFESVNGKTIFKTGQVNCFMVFKMPKVTFGKMDFSGQELNKLTEPADLEFFGPVLKSTTIR